MCLETSAVIVLLRLMQATDRFVASPASLTRGQRCPQTVPHVPPRPRPAISVPVSVRGWRVERGELLGATLLLPSPAGILGLTRTVMQTLESKTLIRALSE